MANKKYWQSFGELNRSKAHKKLSENEFQEDLPFVAEDGTDLGADGTSRRDFLKYMGFTTAAAMAASCEAPVNKMIPYLNKPQDLVPGMADFYATTYVNGGEAVSIVAKVRDGRPIKIEGNTLSTITKGNTSARVQASVLDLYDSARIRFPMQKGNAISYDDLDKKLAVEMTGPVVLLTSTITSPTTKEVIAGFLAKDPANRHIQFDAISYSGMLLANQDSYGKKAIPSYHFETAKVIVSLGADFLGTWLNAVEYQKAYTAGRKINQANPEMSKHFQFESMMSMTGANADDRITHRPSESGVIAAALLSAVNGQGATGVEGKVKAGIEKAAKELLANRGRALVVSGSNNKDIQVIVNAINEAVGANGTTIDWSAPLLSFQGLDSEMTALVADMEAGRVGSLLVYGVNPAYEYFDAERFKKALARVKTTVSFNDRLDETTELCKYVLPAPHFLESWGDVEIKTGYFSMLQPTIYPLFQTRPFQDSLLKWSGATGNYEAYFRNFWLTRLGNPDLFNKALQEGVVEPAAPALATAAYNAGTTAGSVSAVAGLKKNGKYEVVVYQKVSLGEGRQGNNPWLQELPDPITKATWDNYAIVSPQFGKEVLGIDLNDQGEADDYEVFMKKPVIKLKVGAKEMNIPVLIIPGTQANTIAVAVGFGRHSANKDNSKINLGRAIAGIGQNAYPLLAYNGTTVNWTAGEATAEYLKSEEYEVAQTQTHSTYEGRHEVIKEFTLADLKKNPELVREERNVELKAYGGIEKFEKDGTLYPVYERPGIKWGMAIDLNSCFGCGACVVACNAENNVPVVGKSEVLRFHEMHWLRIDRYYSAANNNVDDADGVQVIFQPMLCQHCDNAPCENVCPVAATSHSSEGINMMIYNRCIGTRYCGNNCPYKVRRFNWADYTGADSFPDNQLKEGVGKLDDAVFAMNDDLTRMVLNPDVTVRSRGVIEKCSFCVQRTQEGKLRAKRENRRLDDSDVKTACQQACAGDSIVFGDANNPESEVSRVRRDNSNRQFYSLEQIHTIPNVSYLAKIRNTEHISAHAEAAEHLPGPAATGAGHEAGEGQH
jgi:MoCo/4Fe-4S cofactor protein with predicted Tat translocation signal